MTVPLAARRLDELGAAALAPRWAVSDAGWLARLCPRAPFRRANSVLPPPGATGTGDDAAVIERLEERYAASQLATRILVSEADPAAELLDAALADRGYVHEAPVTVMALAGTTPATPATSGPLGADPSGPAAGVVRTEVVAPLDETWAARASEAADDDRGVARAWGHHELLTPPDAPVAFGVLASRSGSPVGSGVGVLGEADGRTWCGVLGMSTGEGHRRRGVGRAVLSTIVWAAGARAATGCWLQVEDASVAAPLYRSAGFVTSHRTHYRTAAHRRGGPPR